MSLSHSPYLVFPDVVGTMRTCLLLFSSLLVEFSSSFVSVPMDRPAGNTLHFMAVVDPQVLSSLAVSPAEMTTLVAAAVGACGGVVSQQPRIQQLQHELAEARLALNETESAMQVKMNALQDKLFEMDNEYEAQTARFKKQYDTKMQDELKRTVAKLKQDYDFKLQISLDKEKSAMLSKQLDKVNQGMDRVSELSTLRMQQEQMKRDSLKLEQALEESQQELERMRQAASTRQKVFGIF